MINHGHEQIQRYLYGPPDAAGAAALQAALHQDAQLRALYLNYVNLDVALGAAAEAATLLENTSRGTAPFPRRPAKPAAQRWRWLAAAAACGALAILALRPGPRNPAPTNPDIAAACAATETSIARLAVEPSATLPPWASPTVSMLDEPQISK